jgi:hypothetical protein
MSVLFERRKIARHVRIFAGKPMKPFKNKQVLVFLGLLDLIVVIPLVVFLVLVRQNEHMSGGLTSGPVISPMPLRLPLLGLLLMPMMIVTIQRGGPRLLLHG